MAGITHSPPPFLRDWGPAYHLSLVLFTSNLWAQDGFFQNRRGLPRVEGLCNTTLHHNSQWWKAEANGGKGKCSECQGFISHPACDRTNCDLLKTTWNKGEAQLGSSVVSEGDSKQHSPLSAVWAWKEGLAMSAVIPHSIISSSQLLSAAILCWQSFRDKRQSYRLFLTVPLILPKMHWILLNPTLPAAPCRTSTAQDPHHQTRTDERHPEGDNICAQAAPWEQSMSQHIPLACPRRNFHG